MLTDSSKFCFLLFSLCHFQRVFSTNPSVLIVGAGPAGIAAATKLFENSITNITILEAEHRIGGRINSVKFGDAFVDVGAEYCHGEKENVVYEMVKDLNLLKQSHLPFPPTKLYYSNGSAIDFSLAHDLEQIIFNYDDIARNSTAGISLKEAFLNAYNSSILQKYGNDNQKIKILKEGILFAESLILMHEGAFSWERPSAKRNYQACEGDQGMTWKHKGYQIIFEILMKSYPNPNEKIPIDNKILLNKKVTKIIWNDKEIIVKCLDNTTFTADHIIFTPSVGVLQEQQNLMFEPQLPSSKLEAIKAIGFDGVIKIILHFPHRWWKDNDFFFLWSEEDLKNIPKEFPHGPSKNGISWVSHIAALVRVAANPNVLIAWVSGDLVSEIEQTPEQIVLDGSMYVIHKFLGKDYNVTTADQIIRSQWCTNSNFRGTYSFEKTEYFKEHISYQAKLADPVNNSEGSPILLFAGEATSPKHYSTVHGAIESGQREAQRIISLYNK